MILSFPRFALISGDDILARNERRSRCYGTGDRQDREGSETGGGAETLLAEKSLRGDRIQKIRTLPTAAIYGE